MAKYRLSKRKSFDNFHREWFEVYVIEKKHWFFGWCQKAITPDLDEVMKMVSNLIQSGNEVSKDWKITDDIEIK